MVNLKPYVHWKINNDIVNYDNIDPNYLWATIVETNKGPINTPVVCESAAQAKRLFDADVEAYFAQGADYLVVVRAAAESADNKFDYSSVSIETATDFTYKKVIQPHYVAGDKEYSFISYSDATGANEYGRGTVKTTGVVNGNYAEVEVITNSTEQSFVGQKFFIVSNAQADGTLYQLYRDAGTTAEDIFVSIELSSDNSIDNGPRKYVMEDNTKIPVIPLTGSSMWYVKATEAGEPDETSTKKYPYTDVLDEKDVETVNIPAGTTVITLMANFPGDYDLSLVLYQNLIYKGYNITLEETGNGYVTINNVTDLLNIVNRINDANLNVTAYLTPQGEEIVSVTRSSPKIANETFSNVAVGQILALDENTPEYLVELKEVDAGAFRKGSNGEWDNANGRVSADYQVSAHKKALESLRSINIAGIACLYGEDIIQREYILHGSDPSDPYTGMNSNMVCRWRYIVIGANDEDRSSITSLRQKAISINDEYVLLMGQGLVDGNTILKPYECTLYLAGLRAVLHYGDSIFGGQSKKGIKPVNSSLRIAPLFTYENTLVWEPLIYTELNEAGVLTFTTEYGQLTFTDGVTTRQRGTEEDEEGVVSILKYIQHGVQNICTKYIGRNINSDLQAGLEMSITAFLESMTSEDQTLIALPDEGIPAYEVEVVMNPRSTQLVGKIYVYLKVTPVHALRQIEVEMTVQ